MIQRFTLTFIVLAFTAPTYGQAPLTQPEYANIEFWKVHPGETLELVTPILIQQQVPQQYTVKVPIVDPDDGTKTFRKEVRTRTVTVRKTVMKRVKAKGQFEFINMEGKLFTEAEVLHSLPKGGKYFVLLHGKSIPAAWKELLKPKTMFIRRLKMK